MVAKEVLVVVREVDDIAVLSGDVVDVSGEDMATDGDERDTSGSVGQSECVT